MKCSIDCMSARLPANACHSALVKLMGDLGHSAHSLASPADMSTNTIYRAVSNPGTITLHLEAKPINKTFRVGFAKKNSAFR